MHVAAPPAADEPAAAPATPILHVEGVVAGYGEQEILHGISVSLFPSEVVAVIGPNGSGKSTLMKSMFGLVKVSGGHVTFKGKDITNLAPDQIARHGLSYVPQTDNIFPSLSIHENLEMGGFLRPNGIEGRMETVYGLFPDLTGRRKLRAGHLSGGQRQMLAMGRALMLEPEVLLLDEPSAGLSPKMVDVVFQKVMEINALGTTILLVEQNARVALSLADRAYVLAMGNNRLDGRARDLLENEDVGRLYLGR
jgi:ABC-type branched-subunit amino acid transport system ATPase component